MLAESAAGELIAAEIEIRSGRCARPSPRRWPRSASAARRLFELVERDGAGAGARPGRTPGPTTSTSGSSTRRTTTACASELGWVAQRNNTWSMHVHMGVRGADRAIAVCDWMRELLPLLLAVSANSPFLDRRDTGLHTVRTEIFTRTFPRCGIPSPFGDWDELRRLRRHCWSGPGRSSSRPSSGGASAPTTSFGTVEVRICDAQTRGEESFGLAGADRRLHRPDGARLRRARLRRRRRAAARPRDRGEPLAGDPPRDERQADRLPPRRGGRGAGGAGGAARVDRAGPRASSGSRSTCRSATAPSGPARRSTPASRSRTSTATRCGRRTAPTPPPDRRRRGVCAGSRRVPPRPHIDSRAAQTSRRNRT